MRPSLFIAPLTLGLALGLGTHARAGEPLRFNPFLEPDPALLQDRGADVAPRRSAGEWRPILRATLVAGEQSLVNLGGVVLRRGEETHGYRLLEVRNWEAVFSRKGERVVLPVTRDED